MKGLRITLSMFLLLTAFSCGNLKDSDADAQISNSSLCKGKTKGYWKPWYTRNGVKYYWSNTFKFPKGSWGSGYNTCNEAFNACNWYVINRAPEGCDLFK